MTSSSHDESHALLLPRAHEREGYERLDQLLAAVRSATASPTVSATLVANHVAALVANINHGDHPASRAISDYSPSGIIRWLEIALGTEIDQVLTQLLSTTTACPECARIWMQHLLEARRVVSDWAWVREAESQLP